MEVNLDLINEAAADVPLEEFGVAAEVEDGQRVNIFEEARLPDESLQPVLVEMLGAADADERDERNALIEIIELQPDTTARIEALAFLTNLMNELHTDNVDRFRADGFLNLTSEHFADLIAVVDNGSGYVNNQAGGRSSRLAIAASSGASHNDFMHSEIYKPVPQRRPTKARANSDLKCYLCTGIVHNAVVTICGHIFCWSCLWTYERFRLKNARCPRCCYSLFMQEDVVPLYGGDVAVDNDNDNIKKTDSVHSIEVPRPSAYCFDANMNWNGWFFVDEESRRAAYSQPKRRFKCAFNGESSGRICGLLRKIEIFVIALILLIWIVFDYTN